MMHPESMPTGPVRFLPTLAVFLFLIHLGWVLADPDKPLSDPGTGWHVKMGQLLVEEGRLSDTDPLSYTLPGRPWINYQWLSQGIMGILHQAGGLPLVTAGWAVLFGWIPVWMARQQMRKGVPVLVAWFLAFLGYLIMTMHAQVRPHVLTYVLLAVQLGLLARGGRLLWLLPLLFVLWTNLHAGFTAGLLVLACHAAGECGECVLRERRVPWKLIGFWFLLGCACGLGTLVNPWGISLHRHILELQGMQMVAWWDEYQPVWRHSGANMGLFYILAVAWVATVVGQFRSIGGGRILVGMVLLVFAVGAARHVNLFVIASIPVVGGGVGVMLNRWPAGRLFAGSWPLSVQLRGGTTWGYVAVASAAFAVLACTAPLLFRQDLRGLQVGAGILEALEEVPAEDRMFHPESIGGVLAYTFGPGRKIFVDDRLDYYGDAFFLETYLPLIEGRENWSTLLDSYRVGTVLVPRNAGLARVMEESPDWQMFWSDRDTLIFRRTGQ